MVHRPARFALFLSCALLLAVPAMACITGQCHTDQTTGAVVHPPAAEQECRSCHQATDTEAAQHQKDPETFTDFALATGEEGEVVCLDCHDPFPEEEHSHPPVADGECTGCHSPHASEQKHLLLMDLPALCLSCHDGMEEDLQQDTVHPPVEENCLDCHLPHTSPNDALLVEPPEKLCLDCHQEATPELVERMTAASHPHPPVADGECLECHQPHATATPSLLRAQGAELCGICHEETTAKIDKATNQHPPVEEGECTACHGVHGTDQPKLLAASYSTAFYNQYGKATYALCFRCHDPGLVERETAAGEETNFRNGSRNLHWVHVIKRKKKGRGCHVCHDPHASSQPFMLHRRVPFRKRRFRLKITFSETATGGTCVVGCHKPQTYSRETGKTAP